MDEVTFSCGTKANINSTYGHYAQQPVDQASQDLIDHFIQRNLERAEEMMNGPVLLIKPQLDAKSDGLNLPVYWCVVELTKFHAERAYRNCCVQWYQDSLVHNAFSWLADWAAHRTWEHIVDEALQRTS